MDTINRIFEIVGGTLLVSFVAIFIGWILVVIAVEGYQWIKEIVEKVWKQFLH
jgi:hypothetical protein